MKNKSKIWDQFSLNNNLNFVMLIGFSTKDFKQKDLSYWKSQSFCQYFIQDYFWIDAP